MSTPRQVDEPKCDCGWDESNGGFRYSIWCSKHDGPQQSISIGAVDSTCANCHKRTGTIAWVGEGGTMAYIHGMYVMWCELCATEAQLKHARERAAEIPELEAKLAELLKS